MRKPAKWRCSQPAKTNDRGDKAWWYGDRDGITVVSERRRDGNYVGTIIARITRKQVSDYMREVPGRKKP